MEKTRPQEKEPFVSKRIVVKIGTSTLTGGGSLPDMDFMNEIARQTAILHQNGVEVIIVSSGAVGLGKREDFPTADIVDNQVESVFGQTRLMTAWTTVFADNKIEDVGQVLLTDADLLYKRGNTKEVLSRSMKRGIVIVNCNDAVTDEEMRKVSKSIDNDKLASDVVSLVDADTFLILGDKDGVMAGNELVPFVDRLEDIYDLATGTGTGTGGPTSKWVEAKDVAKSGKRSIIANGREMNVVLRVARGERVGTLFIPGYATY